MADAQLQPTEQVKWTVRHGQVMKVLAAMSDGMTQAEACALVGIGVRTYQRWISRPEMQQVIQQFAVDALNAGRVIALNTFPTIVQHQAKIASGGDGQPRDSTKAAEFITRLLQQILQSTDKPQAAAADVSNENDGVTVTAEFKPRFQGQKLTVSVETESSQVIDGQSTVVEESG